MLVLTEENKKRYIGKRGGDNSKPDAQPQKATSVWSEIASLPDDRKQKVLNIRRQLKEKTYDLDKHLDAPHSKLLNELRKQNNKSQRLFKGGAALDVRYGNGATLGQKLFNKL